jgi:hypothetical protein
MGLEQWELEKRLLHDAGRSIFTILVGLASSEGILVCKQDLRHAGGKIPGASRACRSGQYCNVTAMERAKGEGTIFS